MLYPNIEPMRFGLRVAPENIARVSKILRKDLGLPADAMVNQARIKALSLGIFEQTFTVTGALNILTLSVAGFSIMMSLLTLAQMRLPQLAPIWALGVTRAQLGRLELIRSVVLAAVVTCLAVPLGLALSWVSTGGGQCCGLRVAIADVPVPEILPRTLGHCFTSSDHCSRLARATSCAHCAASVAASLLRRTLGLTKHTTPQQV